MILKLDTVKTRTCESGQWGLFGTCVDPDVCLNGTTQTQVCGLNGNGSQTRTCISGQWGDLSACSDPDICTNGLTQNQSCDVYNSNNNGVQSRICSNGQWGNYGTCIDPDTCTNGTTGTQVCGLNNNGAKTRTCANGQWGEYDLCVDPDICTNGTTENQACGLNNNGTQTKTCANGIWGNFGTCQDTDICLNGELSGITEYNICGFDLTGDGIGVCEDGQWESNSCTIFDKLFGTTQGDIANGITMDINGNVYITGQTRGGLDGNTNSGNYDIFLIKYNSSGEKKWTRQWGTTSNDYSNSVAVDSDGNIYITGYTMGGLDGNANIGSSDIFLTKFNSLGVKQWTKQWGTTNDEEGNSVTVDTLNNVFVAGNTIGALDGNTSSGGNDIFITKFDAIGNKLFTKQIGSASDDICKAIAIDINGDVFITGSVGAAFDGNTFSGQTDVFLTKYNNSGDKQWSKTFGTTVGETGNSLTVDNNGNIYITGYTQGALTGVNNGGTDVFIRKYNTSGTALWTKQIGTNNEDSGNSIKLDDDGNFYITGSTNGGIQGNPNLGSSDIFLTKVNPNGSVIISKQWGSSGADKGNGMVVDNYGNIFITGFVTGNLFTNTAIGSNDLFLIKYSLLSVEISVKQWGTTTGDSGNSVAVDGDGNVFVTGYTYGGLDGNTNGGNGHPDIFLTKWNSAGVKQWTKQWGTTSDDYGNSVAVDLDGNVFVTGYTTGGLDGNTNVGSDDVVLTKYNTSGVKQWTKQWGTTTTDLGNSVAIDNSGNILVTGYTTGGLDGNSNVGSSDVVLTKYNTSGVKQWTKQWGTTSEDYGKSVAVNGAGQIFITGYTAGGFDGNTNAGSNDIFLLKYKE